MAVVSFDHASLLRPISGNLWQTDLVGSDSATALMALQRLQKRGTAEAIDVGIRLLEHPWGHVRQEAQNWLLPLAAVKRPASDEAAVGPRDRAISGRIRRWWAGARATWTPPP